nr:hypothetical protein CPGR_04930 [Mycolicibacterium malmesburyense]
MRPGLTAMQADRRAGDLWTGEQRVLDLAQFQPLPPQLDLTIGAPQIIQRSRRVPPHQIPAAIHPRPGRPIGIGHEPLSGQLRPAHITTRHRRPTQVQLTDHPDRRRVQSRIKHQRAHPRDRGAYTHRLTRRQHITRHPDGGLGRTIGVEHRSPRRPRRHQFTRTRFTAGDQRAQPLNLRRIQRRQHRRSQQRGIHPVGLQHLHQRLPGISIPPSDHQRRCRPHRPQPLEDRGIESRRGHHQNPRPRTHPEQSAMCRSNR